MTCPYCGKWTPDTECLSDSQEVYTFVLCRVCNKVFAISWEILHSSVKLEDAAPFTAEQALEIAEATH
jgi:transcription elongation factor Elf1